MDQQDPTILVGAMVMGAVTFCYAWSLALSQVASSRVGNTLGAGYGRVARFRAFCAWSLQVRRLVFFFSVHLGTSKASHTQSLSSENQPGFQSRRVRVRRFVNPLVYFFSTHHG